MKKNKCENCGQVKLAGIELTTDRGKKIFICNDCLDRLRDILDTLLNKPPDKRQ